MVGRVEIKHEYSNRNSQYNLVIFSDTHYGNIAVDKPRLRKQIQWAKHYADAILLGGDYCEHINPRDRRFEWATIDRQLATPDEQYQAIVKEFDPVSDLIISVGDGNHDMDTHSANGHNYVKKDMSEYWDTVYGHYSTYVKLRFNRGKHRTLYNLYWHHGKTGARTKGGKLNKVMTMEKIFDADIYAMSHVHDLDFVNRIGLWVDDNWNIRERQRYFTLTGGFLKGYEWGASNYVERGMYAPTSLGGVVISITCEKHMNPNVRIWNIPVEA